MIIAVAAAAESRSDYIDGPTAGRLQFNFIAQEKSFLAKTWEGGGTVMTFAPCVVHVAVKYCKYLYTASYH